MTNVCPPVDRKPSGNFNGRDGFSLVIFPGAPSFTSTRKKSPLANVLT